MRLTLAIAALALASACAGRGDREPPRPPAAPERVVLSGAAFLMVAADADRDLRTTRSEIEAAIATETARAFASGEELRAVAFEDWAARALGAPALGPFRLEFDANVDGVITKAEFADAIRARFDLYDRDDDGVVLRAELSDPTPLRNGPPGPPPAPQGLQELPPNGPA